MICYTNHFINYLYIPLSHVSHFLSLFLMLAASFLMSTIISCLKCFKSINKSIDILNMSTHHRWKMFTDRFIEFFNHGLCTCAYVLFLPLFSFMKEIPKIGEIILKIQEIIPNIKEICSYAPFCCISLIAINFVYKYVNIKKKSINQAQQYEISQQEEKFLSQQEEMLLSQQEIQDTFQQGKTSSEQDKFR